MATPTDTEEGRRSSALNTESRDWTIFGRRVPKNELVYLSQVVVLFTVISVGLYNLTTEQSDTNLWTALVGSCLGYLLPNPRIEK